MRPPWELLDGHLEQCAPASVLRDAERGLDVEAQRDRAMRLDGDVHAALSFDDAGQKPASLLATRQPFLLIACTVRIVTAHSTKPRASTGRIPRCPSI
jgi:hypothetical protein